MPADLTHDHMLSLLRVAGTPGLVYRDTTIMRELHQRGLVTVSGRHLVHGKMESLRWVSAAGIRQLHAYLDTLPTTETVDLVTQA
jgi:hypothetical protein